MCENLLIVILHYLGFQSETDLDSINVTVELISMILVKNYSYLLNVTDPQNWTSITVIAENQ